MSRDNWRTPPEVFAALNDEFEFRLDAAASEHNALTDYYITSGEDCLTTCWLAAEGSGERGWYAWLNPPYSNIRPFVARAAEMAKRGVGTVMLVMMDQSVGWYKDAIETCQEVRLVVGGRLAFLDESGKRVNGNNKGSMFLIWHPYGRTDAVVSHVERDSMMKPVGEDGVGSITEVINEILHERDKALADADFWSDAHDRQEASADELATYVEQLRGRMFEVGNIVEATCVEVTSRSWKLGSRCSSDNVLGMMTKARALLAGLPERIKRGEV